MTIYDDRTRDEALRSIEALTFQLLDERFERALRMRLAPEERAAYERTHAAALGIEPSPAYPYIAGCLGLAIAADDLESRPQTPHGEIITATMLGEAIPYLPSTLDARRLHGLSAAGAYPAYLERLAQGPAECFPPRAHLHELLTAGGAQGTHAMLLSQRFGRERTIEAQEGIYELSLGEFLDWYGRTVSREFSDLLEPASFKLD